MAFLKYAKANIVKPDINIPAWDTVLQNSQALGKAFASREASKIVLDEYNPQNYLLTHSTIVASVDTENGPGPLGTHMEGGFSINRRFQDYSVTPKTVPYINNNFDAFERKLLLSTFRSFIGAEHYLEHLQVPEMSKGKIIDAAARDIGDSIYIDILVATHRKHKPLLAAITSRQIQTLSMGCTILYSICTKCGNVASDETELCPHVKYEKGNQFIGPLGQVLKVAELCGHSSEPNSVRFIEASWVANPAFKGAVLRAILTPEETAAYTQMHAARTQVLLSSPSPAVDPSLRAKAARFKTTAFGDQQDFPGGDADSTPKDQASPLDKAVNDLADLIRSRAVKRVQDELEGPKEPPSGNSISLDETLIKNAGQDPTWRKVALQLYRASKDIERSKRILAGLVRYKAGGWNAVNAGNYSGREMLVISRFLDTLQGIPSVAGEARIYRTVIAVGGAKAYGTDSAYLAACSRVLGREPTSSERTALLAKGRIFDLGH